MNTFFKILEGGQKIGKFWERHKWKTPFSVSLLSWSPRRPCKRARDPSDWLAKKRDNSFTSQLLLLLLLPGQAASSKTPEAKPSVPDLQRDWEGQKQRISSSSQIGSSISSLTIGITARLWIAYSVYLGCKDLNLTSNLFWLQFSLHREIL